MAHVSLYRRYRPGRFAALRGQDHIVRALTHAVATDTSSHAYLFSGPRGTGKTSTARILAKALNCTDLTDGEPCGECESCRAIEAGTSYDLFELDAASNNGVDAMRDLIGRTAVGSPGRTKVYILDEVHMLSPAASNALLKTLEEPPDHVTFVLATTDPQKVLPTIRSRTQHFEFQLLTAAELDAYVRWVVADAGLTLDDPSIAQVVRQGRGSARDTLSALDLAVAAGGISDRAEPVDGILAAISDRDVGAAVVAVADAVAQGREPRVLAEALMATLRDAFLVAVGADSGLLSDIDRERLTELSRRIGTPALTRSLEGLGAALVDMRQASDPRVPLEVALIRLCDPALDTSVASLVERVERLERQGGRARPAPNAGGEPDAGPTESLPDAADPAESGVSRPPASGGAAAARSELARAGSGRAPRPTPPVPPGRTPTPAPPPATAPVDPPAPAVATEQPIETTPTSAPVTAPTDESKRPAAAAPAPTAPEPAPAPSSPSPAPSRVSAPSPDGFPTRDELASAMSDHVLASLRGIAKAIYSGGRFVSVADDAAVFALNNAATRDRAERVRTDVEAALAAHFGRPIPLRLVDETTSAAAGGSGSPEPDSRRPMSAAATAPESDHDEESMDRSEVAELADAPDVASGGVDRIVQAFPGAVVVEQENP